METQDFEQYAKERVDRIGRVPLSGSIEVTGRCNLRCAHCYMTGYRDEAELRTHEILRVLDELADAGCVQLLITGGEPLLREDFREIWRHAKKKGFLLTLFTNAALADAETAAFLADHPPVFCETTLYGASPETYGRVCGNPSAFDAVLAGLDRLREALPKVGAKGMILRENAGDIGAMTELCEKRGLEFYFDTDIFPRLDGDTEPLGHAFEPEEGARMVLESDIHRRTWKKQAEDWNETKGAPLKRNGKVVVCRAGEYSFHIGPYGDLCLCMLLREPSYSLRLGDFRTGWETVILELLERERRTPAACSNCPDLKYCVPCAGRNLLETGSPERLAPLLCARAHAVRDFLENPQSDTSREEAARYART